MSSQPSAPRVLRFGLFEVDRTAASLSKQGRPIKLQDQPFQVLNLLLQHPGDVVTREELQKALWPADTFVEFDQGLNTAIKKIRQALDDSADSPRYIETIPRRGYRFIAPVSGLEPVAAPVAPRRIAHFAVALAAIVVAGLAAWLLLHARARTAEAPPVPVPLTSYPGDEGNPSFSPDGNQVAFDWRPAGQPYSDIYVKLVGSGEPMRLTHGPLSNSCPAWSPDGRSIAFMRDLPGGSALFLTSPLGGVERQLIQINSCAVWHPSGKWLVLAKPSSPGEPLALFSIAVQTGEMRRLTFPPRNSVGDMSPAVSPGGDALVFSRELGGNTAQLYLSELSAEFSPRGPPAPITPRFSGYAPAWMPDGRGIVFSGGSRHRPNLYRMAFARGWHPGKPEPLLFAGAGVRDPAISRQGRLAYSTMTVEGNIWRLELNGGHPVSKSPTRLIASTHLDHTPEYSPDGRRIAFASDRSGSHEIWLCNSDGTGTFQVTNFGGLDYTANPHWSPDGRQISFSSTAEAHTSTYLVNPEGGEPRHPGTEGPQIWSRDGRSVYFQAQGEIWKKPADGGAATQISRGGACCGSESPDGRHLYYLKADEDLTSLWKVPAGGGEASKVLESVLHLNFAVAPQGIYFIPDYQDAKDEFAVQFLSFATGKVNTVKQLSGQPSYGFSVSPDGRWLLYSRYEPKGIDLWTVEHFTRGF